MWERISMSSVESLVDELATKQETRYQLVVGIAFRGMVF